MITSFCDKHTLLQVLPIQFSYFAKLHSSYWVRQWAYTYCMYPCCDSYHQIRIERLAKSWIIELAPLNSSSSQSQIDTMTAENVTCRGGFIKWPENTTVIIRAGYSVICEIEGRPDVVIEVPTTVWAVWESDGDWKTCISPSMEASKPS